MDFKFKISMEKSSKKFKELIISQNVSILQPVFTETHIPHNFEIMIDNNFYSLHL